MGSLPLFQYFNRPTNLAFHDLTTTLTPPQNLRSLLGLGLKFIPTPDKTTTRSQLYADKTGTFTRLDRAIQLRCFFVDHDPLDPSEKSDDYNPRMYIPSKRSIPNNVPRALDARLSDFKSQMNTLFRPEPKIRPNLLRHQRHALQLLREQKDFLVVHCDKNLGPAIIERDAYLRLALDDHLQDRDTYKYLGPNAVADHKARIKNEFAAWFKRHKKVLSKSERLFLMTHTAECTDFWPYFYLLMKVQKTPLKTRPIVSCAGSFLYALGVWVDDKLQAYAKKQKSYFKSSFDLKQELTTIVVPDNAVLFTSDAISMYTNIPTTIALNVISGYLHRTGAQFSAIPARTLVEALKLVMENNIIQFGDTHWRQRTGAAMGTPPAPPYATLYYALFENILLDEYGANLLLYRRFIDDVLGIWVPTTADPAVDAATFDDFANRMNAWPGLTWETSDRTPSVVFMDLTIRIEGRRITTSLYSKPLNLYLYIPPMSSHPPGVLSGLISGVIFRIYTLCSEKPDVRARLQDFWNRLLARGYTAVTIETPFRKGIANAKSFLLRHTVGPTDAESQPLFFHLRYHPQDPPSSDIQDAWKHLVVHPPLQVPLASLFVKGWNSGQLHRFAQDRLIVCYSRPHNLGNLLSYRKIKPNSGPPVSSFL
jgi:hypothetical protein